jgi:hypothetical protein
MEQIMRLPRRRLFRVALFAAVGLVVIAGAWGGIYWARYPKVPDVSKAPLDEVMHFAATDDFNRMAEWHRRRYLLGLASRMHEKSFSDLVAIMMMGGDADRKKQRENEKLLTEADRKEVEAAYFRLLLDKFFEMSKSQRSNFLLMAVLAEKAGSSHHPGQPPGMPTAAQIQKGMSDFLSQQPPHVAAQVDEAINEMNQKRQLLGVKGPW